MKSSKIARDPGERPKKRPTRRRRGRDDRLLNAGPIDLSSEPDLASSSTSEGVLARDLALYRATAGVRATLRKVMETTPGLELVSTTWMGPFHEAVWKICHIPPAHAWLRCPDCVGSCCRKCKGAGYSIPNL